MGPRVGSLFSGYGGAELALEQLWPEAEVAWVSDIEPGPCRVLAHRYPDAPNLGDITTIDWANVEPVDIITGGYPCQPFSHAGKRAGTNDERHLWPHVVEALSYMRPRMAIFENVAGHLSLGFDQVLRDLELLGYEAIWTVIAASDVGACHRRKRIFILATEARHGQLRGGADRRRGLDRNIARQGGEHLCDSCAGRDGNQGVADPVADATEVRGSDKSPTTGDAPKRSEGRVGGGGLGGERISHSSGATPDTQDSPGGLRPGAVALNREEPRGEGSQTLERGAEKACASFDARSTGTERARTEAGEAHPAEPSGTGLSSLGRVVGEGRVSFRPSTVSGQVSSLRDDDRGSAHGDTCVACGKSPAWPADAESVGWERRWAPRAGRLGLEDGHRRALIPSPRASDADHAGPNQRGSRGDLTVASAIAQLPTPRATRGGSTTETLDLLPTPAVNDMGAGKEPDAWDAWDAWTDTMRGKHGNGNGHGKSLEIEAKRLPLLPTPVGQDAAESGGAPLGTNVTLTDATVRLADTWGNYAPAIMRASVALGRPAPAPTLPTGRDGKAQLSPRFEEFMMMLPDQWVTNPAIWEGVKGARNQQVRMLGNGIVPAQMAEAVRWCLEMRAATSERAS